MKCKRCKEKAEIKVRQHNAAFCRPCFVFFVQRQVQRTIEQDKMFGRDDHVLVAVSGGKDSLALWEILGELGYATTGVHLALGIGDYSAESTRKTEEFARARGLELVVVDLSAEAEPVPVLARFTNRPPCAACGLAKRHFMDRVADERGFKVLATGHNLDDEAARLMGNVMHWQMDYLAKQRPVLEAGHERFARKVRPLYRLTEYEMAAYAFFRGIDYILDECPNSVGATQLVYKEALNRIEADMPGAKMSFVREFLRNAQPVFAAADKKPDNTCSSCGMPSFAALCAFCNLRREVQRKRAERGSPAQP
jgi:uncharacterized protein (TIGR00269 family)